MIAGQRDAGRRLFFLCRRLGLLPKHDETESASAPRLSRDHMTVRSDEAAAMLADVERCRGQGQAIAHLPLRGAPASCFWGVVDLLRDVLIALEPVMVWPALVPRRSSSASSARSSFCASRVGSGRPLSAARAGGVRAFLRLRLDPVLTPRGSSVRASRWRSGRPSFVRLRAGRGCGSARRSPRSASASRALIVAGYLWAGDAFTLWQAAVTGLGFIVCGLWMRRA